MNTVEEAISLAFIVYIAFAGGTYIVLNAIAFFGLKRYVRLHRVDDELSLYTGLEPPITVVVPAYNEGLTIVSSIRSILQLHYPEMEIVIVNDGSKDNTLQALIDAFDFEPFEECVRESIPTKPIRRVYLSRSINNLRLVDKDNGGKADAINAGINLTRSPLFCCIDADSVLEPSSLLRVVQPFLTQEGTVASGGTVRIANGCKVRYGHIVKRGVPSNVLAMFQLIEYLRAFLFGRMGWAEINGLLIISGAFGVFHKESVARVGGYATGTIGEDMELIVRMHRLLPKMGYPSHVDFTPDPVCWTEAPEKLKDLQGQRVRWHRGLTESLYLNRGLLFARGSGVVGWFSFPFFVIVEWFGPFVELAGYLFTIYLLVFADAQLITVLLVYLFAVSMSVFLSVIGFLLDEITHPGGATPKELLRMTVFSLLECFGYRQLNMYYRLKGAINWMTGAKSTWGSMSRTGTWQSK